MKPLVAIVGRPNVGKSAFFNYREKKRISIVEDTPGVTRDRIYADIDWRGREFILIDTGGIEPYSEDKILRQMKTQAEIAIDTADVILFMVDIKDGVTVSDKEVSTMLRRAKKPVIVVVNKVDNIGEMPLEFFEFFSLGFEDMVGVSSLHGLGIGDLLDEVYKHFPNEDILEEDNEITKVAVIGKPNVGKSSLINKILGEERVIVSDVPGTTRDAIDTYFDKDDNRYILIDTAGIRRKSRVSENIERYSILRSFAAIERSDVCLIMIDAQEGVTEQDTKIAGFAHEQGKASIIVVNKWDIVEKQTGTMENYRKKVYDKLSFMTYSPILFISAKTGQRVDRVFELINFVSDQSAFRISTGMLNDFVNEITAMVQPPSDKGKRLKLYYITQSGVKPPTFIVFINDKDLMHFSYQRYVENQLRKSFGFEGTPIRFSLREKKGG